MNKKERIIELVKQNIITMDEALTLLEAAGQEAGQAIDGTSSLTSVDSSIDGEQKDAKKDMNDGQATDQSEQTNARQATTVSDEVKQAGDDIRDAVKEIVDNGLEFGRELISSVQQAIASEQEKETQKSSETGEATHEVPAEDSQEVINLKQEIVAKQAEQKQKQEALLIVQQRLREIEVLAELDELSAETIAQKQALESEKIELSAELSVLEDELTQLNKVVTHTTTSRKTVDTNEPRYQAKYGAYTDRKSSSVGRAVGQVVRGVLRSLKDVSIQVATQMPKSVRPADYTLVKNFEAANIKGVKVKAVHGDIAVEVSDDDTIQVVAKFYYPYVLQDARDTQFERYLLTELVGNQLVVEVKEERGLSVDVTLLLPDDLVEKVTLETVNGDIQLDEVEVGEFELQLTQGDVKVNDVVANKITIETVNGDLRVDDTEYDLLKFKTVNGDARVTETVGNIEFEGVSSDFYVTKEDNASATIKIKTVHGDIKVAVPEKLNVVADTYSSKGDNLNRLDRLDLQQKTDTGRIYLERTLKENNETVHLELDTQFGDIRVKDAD